MLLVLKRDPKKLAQLEKIFWEVSDPTHENYGNHLTQAEVSDPTHENYGNHLTQ